MQNDSTNPGSLSNNDVHAIYEDSKGYLWIGTDGGLNKYDKSTGSFIRYLHDPNNHRSIGSNSVWAIDEDSTGDLWIATDRGISRNNQSR